MFSAASPVPGTEKQVSRDFTCPHCGADVPSDALACPECGSDRETGWSEKAGYDDLLLYDDEPATEPSSRAAWPPYLIVIVAALTLSAFLAYALTWGVYLIPLILVAAGIVIYVTQVFPRQRHSQESQAYQRLLQKARGDRELVMRLIEHERRRSPGADRLKLMQDALYYWERDSR